MNSGTLLGEEVRLRSNLYWNTLVRIPTQVICFAISIFVARLLTPRDFGIIGITMMLIGYANMLTNFGFNEALIQKNINDEKTVNSIFTLDLAISASLATLIFLASRPISLYFNTPECEGTLKVQCSVFIVTSFTAIAHATLRRDLRFRVIAILDVLSSISMAALTLTFAFLQFKYWSLVYGQLLPQLVNAILLCLSAKWKPRIYYDQGRMQAIFNFGIWNFLKSQLAFLVNHIDKFIVGKHLGAVCLGYYEKSMGIAVVPNESIIMNINSVMFSSFSKKQERIDELQADFLKSLTLVSVISFPVYTGLILTAPYFVNVFLGDNWTPMIIPFQIILSGFIFRCLGGLVATMCVAVGRYKAYTLRLLGSGLFFICCCFGALKYGIIGICWSFVVFNIVLILWTTQLCIVAIKITWRDVLWSILPPVYASAGMFVSISTLAHHYFSANSATNLVLICLLGFLVYIGILLIDKSRSTVPIKKRLFKDLRGLIMGSSCS